MNNTAMGNENILSKEDISKLSWEVYLNLFPLKPYEQSEKFGDYDQRVADHYNNLYAEWIKNKQP